MDWEQVGIVNTQPQLPIRRSSLPHSHPTGGEESVEFLYKPPSTQHRDCGWMETRGLPELYPIVATTEINYRIIQHFFHPRRGYQI
jgi:hypothetical protein